MELYLTCLKLAFGIMAMLAPVAIGIAVLAGRERRHRELSTIALQQLNVPELRGLYTVTVHTPWAGSDRVSVDLWNYGSRDRLWDVMERLALRLPPSVRYEVNGLSDSRKRSDRRLSPAGCGAETCGCGPCR